MNLAPPSSQKAAERPISFVLDDQSGTGGGGLLSIDLVIRPEELTRNDPSRISVQQTLGGAWADSFGQGIPTIQISGHTGWRRTESNIGADGVERFKELFDGVYTQWHDRRRRAADAGNDPDKVKLIFADSLDGFSVVVAPMSFMLRRSKSRPLLAQFQIALTVLDEDIDSESYFQYGKGGKLGYLIRGEASGSGLLESLGLESLTGSLNKLDGIVAGIKGAITQAGGLIQSALIGPLTTFTTTINNIGGMVRSAIFSGSSLLGEVVGLARLVVNAGVGVYNSLASVVGLTGQVRSFFMGGAGAIMNIKCLLSNAIDVQQYVPDYSPLFGSSYCSSTSGGRPLSIYADSNPFYDVVPVVPSLPVSVSINAQGALSRLGMLDVVQAPPSQTVLGELIGTVNAGINFATSLGF